MLRISLKFLHAFIAFYRNHGFYFPVKLVITEAPERYGVSAYYFYDLLMRSTSQVPPMNIHLVNEGNLIFTNIRTL